MTIAQQNNANAFTYNAKTDDFAKMLAIDIGQIDGEQVFYGLKTGEQNIFEFPCLFAAKLSEKLTGTVTVNGSPMRVPDIVWKAFKAIAPLDRNLAERIAGRSKQAWQLANILADGSFELAELDNQEGFNVPFFSMSIRVQLGCLMKPILGKSGISSIVTVHPREDVICIQFLGASGLRMELIDRP